MDTPLSCCCCGGGGCARLRLRLLLPPEGAASAADVLACLCDSHLSMRLSSEASSSALISGWSTRGPAAVATAAKAVALSVLLAWRACMQRTLGQQRVCGNPRQPACWRAFITTTATTPHLQQLVAAPRQGVAHHQVGAIVVCSSSSSRGAAAPSLGVAAMSSHMCARLRVCAVVRGGTAWPR